jgi:hypothetical protein
MGRIEFLYPDEDETPEVDELEAEAQAAEEESEDDEAAAAAAAAKERLAKVAEHIRERSRQVQLTDAEAFLAEPFEYTEEELAQVWDDMAASDEFGDIIKTTDEHSGKEWLHSDRHLTTQYATMMLRSQANDPAFLIAETARDHSRIYPQPISARMFEAEPFSMQADDIEATIEAMKTDEAYADIHTVTVSNGVVYLYSTRYMQDRAARKQAQWIEVDQWIYQ